jgi:N-acetylmuramate 1-kinase
MLSGIAICYLRGFGLDRRRHIDSIDTNGERRRRELRAWLRTVADETGNDARNEKLAAAAISPASEDASFRRYFRARAASSSWIVMDAPPDREDSHRFVRIADYLERIGVNSPRVLAADLDRGFLLLTDLGSMPYLTELEANPASATRLYGDALRALVSIQERGNEFKSALPPYDGKLLSFELSLFHDWLCERHLQLEFGDTDEAEWQSCCEWLVGSALEQPTVFVHRDYHSRNLMVTETDNPGILDFQDAVEGPVTYDLVSLLKDCYIKWPAEQVRSRALAFHAEVDASIHGHMPADEFLRAFEIMGVQRHLKAAGIFARLWHRDGKAGYLNDVPRTLGYIIDIAPRYEELSFLARLIEERVLPQLAKRR